MALWGCRSTYWLEHECLHKEDVWVICGPLAPVEVYNALQDDFTAVMISIALAVLLVLVSTLLIYQLLRKDQDPPEFYGRQKLGPGEYGIYEDINYGDVKRHSQISHVSEANSSIGKEDFSANMDAVSVGSAAQQKEGYDDVEVDLDLEQMNDEGMSGREDVGDGRLLHAGSNLGRRRSPSADKPMEQTGGRNEGYDDVGSSRAWSFEAGVIVSNLVNVCRDGAEGVSLCV
ncbi:uncharacterized protein [Narcine bancroftii]|uniref:uncharacterized protein n=1 Tax=Narcine bancroftii TaxID=1343680 RepID=UPI003831F8D0